MPGGGVGWGTVGWGGVRWGRVGSGGGGWGHGEVDLKSTHATPIGIDSIFDVFAWVRHVPPRPSSP